MRFSLLYVLVLLSGCIPSGDDGQRAGTHQSTLILDQHHGDGGSAWGQADCLACHPVQGIHHSAPAIRAIAAQKGGASCTGCHGDNGSGAARRCLLCHNPDDLPSPSLAGGMHAHRFGEASDGVMTDAECVVCHEASDMDGRWEPAVDLSANLNGMGVSHGYNSVSAFCVACHNREQQSVDYPIPFTDPKAKTNGSKKKSYPAL